MPRRPAAAQRIESALRRELDMLETPGMPPRLADAMRQAVLSGAPPGGLRLHPLLCLGVAQACGDDAPDLADAAAAAVELLHCAAHVHDDLPCFEDLHAPQRGPALHRDYGVPLAVLAGDALIVLAFQCLARGAARHPRRLLRLVRLVGDAAGMPGGTIAGQALGADLAVDRMAEHAAKAGALFIAAVEAGAIAAGASGAAWRRVGEQIGLAHRVAAEVAARAGIGGDAGRSGAEHHLALRARRAIEAIPPCADPRPIRSAIAAALRGLRPQSRLACPI